MANFQKAHPENVPGPLFVDTTCIDCGTCFHLGPALFRENHDEKSVVEKQPGSLEEWQEAKRSILSCPTHSIGVKDAPEFFKKLGSGLPLLITNDIYYLGYTSRDSFGATSYLISHPDGNMMVDSPVFNSSLVKEIEKFGGVKWMFLTHEDDVADHQKFHEHFGCQRIIHERALDQGTKDAEVVLKGEASTMITPDFKVIMVPGHTAGHMNLLYQEKFLFTGDHLFVEEGKKLRASSGVSWYSWPKQMESLKKLLNEKFEWVLPGHGGWGYFPGEKAREELRNYLLSLKLM